MNIRPLLIEFTGTPEAGKTTTLRMLQDSLIAEGLKVEIIRESAEIVPAEIPKGDFDYTRYSTIDTSFLSITEVVQQMKKRIYSCFVDYFAQNFKNVL